jgi:hypothetical protein
MNAEPSVRRKRGGRGPGPLGQHAKRFNVWIPRQMFARLEQIAQRNQVDVAVAIRALLRKALGDESSHNKSIPPA